MDYRISFYDTWTPSGPDGKGHNRLTIYPMTPTARCLLKPQTWQAAWESHNRPGDASASMFGHCTGSACATCPIANRERVSYKCGAALAVVREYDDGSVWILNRRDRGWGEFGYRYASWADFVQNENVFLGNRRQDEHGAYFEVI